MVDDFEAFQKQDAGSTPTLVGASVRSVSDHNNWDSVDSVVSSRSPSKANHKTLKHELQEEYTTVNELVDEGALINDEQEYNDLLDESGKVKADVSRNAAIIVSDDQLVHDDEEDADDHHVSAEDEFVKPESSVQSVQLDDDTQKEFVVVDIPAKSSERDETPSSIYELKNPDAEVSLADLIDSQIASISEFSDDLRKKAVKKSSRSRSRKKSFGGIVPDSVIENDSLHQVPAGAPEGSYSPLIQSRSQSMARASSKESSSSGSKPHLARGDSYNGVVSDFRSGRTSERDDPLKRLSAANIEYLRSVSRSRSRMTKEAPISEEELKDEGVLVQDSEADVELQHAVDEAIEHTDVQNDVLQEESDEDGNEVDNYKSETKKPETKESSSPKKVESKTLPEIKPDENSEGEEEDVSEPVEAIEDQGEAGKSTESTADETKSDEEEVGKTTDITEPAGEDPEPGTSQTSSKPVLEESIQDEVSTKDVDEVSESAAQMTTGDALTEDKNTEFSQNEVTNESATIESFGSAEEDNVSGVKSSKDIVDADEENDEEKEKEEPKAEPIELTGKSIKSSPTKSQSVKNVSVVDQTEQLIQELEAELGDASLDDVSKGNVKEDEGEEEEPITNDIESNETTTSRSEEPENNSESVSEQNETEPVEAEKSAVGEETSKVSEISKELETSKAPEPTANQEEVIEEKEEEEELHEPTKEEIIELLKDEPVYLYTSLAGGGFHMPQRTNKLATILTANRISFTYRDLGTDEEARNVWRRYSKGRLLPGIVRGKDDIIGNWEEIEEANEEYRVRELIYETL